MKVVFVFSGILKYKGRLLKQIRTLQEAGHECILIHGQVEETPPTYKSYNFDVVTLRLMRSPNNKLKNTVNLIRFNFQAADKIKELNPGAVVCVELYGALSGTLVRHINNNIKYVFDCNELFMHMGMGHIKKLFWRPIHFWVFLNADFILHAEEQRLKYCRRHYLSKARHILIENLPFAKNCNTAVSPKRNILKPMRLVYIGALMPARGCEEIIIAFSKISPDLASCDFIGFGIPEYVKHLKELLNRNKFSHVRILPPVSHDKVLETLTPYDAGLAFYGHRYLNQYYCAPNKIYDYIACGLPVITNNYPGLKKAIEDNFIGVCISEITTKNITFAINQILSKKITYNITPRICNRFSWEYQAPTYRQIFE